MDPPPSDDVGALVSGEGTSIGLVVGSPVTIGDGVGGSCGALVGGSGVAMGDMVVGVATGERVGDMLVGDTTVAGGVGGNVAMGQNTVSCGILLNNAPLLILL